MGSRAGAAVTSEFLARVLGLPVAEVTYERIGTGRGFAGTVMRATIQARARAPLTVVVKLGPDPALDREVSFYRDLAGPLAAPAPRCWYAGPASDGMPVLILEDLASARPGDALTGASVDNVAAVLGSMVPVWQRPAADRHLCALPVWGGDPRERQERFRARWASQRDELSGELDAETWLIGERLCESFATVAADLQRAPSSWLHADLHLDNVLFEPGGPGTHPVVLDWGSTCVGSSAIDIFPFLAMSLSPEDHTRHAAGMLADLGLPGVTLDDGRRQLLCYFAGVVGWRDRPPGSHPRESALRAAALADGRLVNALRQWDAAAILERPRHRTAH